LNRLCPRHKQFPCARAKRLLGTRSDSAHSRHSDTSRSWPLARRKLYPLAVLTLALLAPATATAQELKGARGIREARRGGVIIACRHAATESADENEQTLRYDDPSTQRRLSERGERQADSLGKAFRALGIRVSEVIASPMQRARRTAELAFGAAQLDSSWHTRGDNYAGPKRDRRLETLGLPVERGNRVIVSHIGTMYSVLPSIQGQLEEGDCVVVRPRGASQFDIVEVVPWRSWVTAASSPR
jgi:phosphohistidine phosphatase SixA